MFGGLGPKLKGGLVRIQQGASTVAACWLKGPPENTLRISAGDGTTGAPVSLDLQGGTSPSSGGAVNIMGGSGTPGGGAVNITGGSTTSGTAGAVTINGGLGATGVAARVNINGGAGNATQSTGAKVVITGGIAGAAVNAIGGDVEISGGGGGNGGPGGNVRIQPGVGFGTPSYGNIQLDCGIGAAVLNAGVAGFITTSAVAGTPTGTPTAGLIPTGSLAWVLDSTNNRAWLYNSGWKRVNFGGAINSRSADYTATLSDGGPDRAILHPSTDANARTFTIPANSSVAYDVGTVLTFINDAANAVTIAITTDTLVLEGAGTTGSRTLAQYGRAVATKISSTRWYITGTNLT